MDAVPGVISLSQSNQFSYWASAMLHLKKWEIIKSPNSWLCLTAAYFSLSHQLSKHNLVRRMNSIYHISTVNRVC